MPPIGSCYCVLPSSNRHAQETAKQEAQLLMNLHGHGGLPPCHHSIHIPVKVPIIELDSSLTGIYHAAPMSCQWF